MSLAARRTRAVRPARSAAAAAAAVEPLEARALFAATPYLVPSVGGVQVVPILTVGDSVPSTSTPGTGYRLVGAPDGLGAYDNGDGTFTLLVNHELNPGKGVARAHGGTGAFVSEYVVDKATKKVLGGEDLVRQVFAFDPAAGAYAAVADYAFNHLCSASLAEPTALYDPATGLGTPDRIFGNGEESADGRAWANVVTGPHAGEAYDLPAFGRLAYENWQANPFPQPLTVAVAQDDANRAFSSEGVGNPSEVYVYVGTKQAGTGNPVADAGLTNDALFGIKVAGAANEARVATAGQRFALAALPDQTGKTGAALQADSIAAGVTQFRRPEDGHWDPTNPRDYYFTTTDQFGGTTRLWRLRFDDPANPSAGGTISVVVNSPSGVAGETFDNLVVDRRGDQILLEDAGDNAYVGKVYKRDASTGDLVQIASHDPALFDPNFAGAGKPGPKFLTKNEESTGVIDLSGILGDGWYALASMAHYPIDAAHNPAGFPDPDELVEGGQLLLLNTSAPSATLGTDGVLKVTGSPDDDKLYAQLSGTAGITVLANGKSFGPFSYAAVKSIVVDAGAGSDDVSLAAAIDRPALLVGGLGDDRLYGGGGRNVIVGGAGKDDVFGRAKDDLLVGNKSSLTVAALQGVLTKWSATMTYAARVSAVRPTLAASLTDDGKADRLTGAAGTDWFFKVGGDVLVDRLAAETVN